MTFLRGIRISRSDLELIWTRIYADHHFHFLTLPNRSVYQYVCVYQYVYDIVCMSFR